MSDTPGGPRIIHFYRKDGCELCDRMAAELLVYRQQNPDGPGFTVEERDIEDDDAWFERYREYVPVLVVNGEEICHYFLDSDDLTEALSCNS